MRMDVGSQMPGARSLPAELKVRGHRDPWVRMRAQYPGRGLGAVVCPDPTDIGSCYSDSGDVGSGLPAGGMGPTDWTKLLGGISSDLARVLAVSQGGSSVGGNFYGSTQAAVTQAQTGTGASGGAGNYIKTPLGTASMGTYAMVGIAAVALFMMMGNRR